MSCTENFIGVRGCTETVPKSGYYIDDLEGINLTNIADISSDQSARALIDAKIAFAIKQTATDVMAHLPNLDFNAFAETMQSYCFSGLPVNQTASQTITKNAYYAPMGKLSLNRIIIKLNQDLLGAVVDVSDGSQVLQSFTVDIAQDIEYVIDDMSIISDTGVLNVSIQGGAYDCYQAPKSLFAWRSGVYAKCCRRACESKFLEASQGVGVVMDASVICSPDLVLCRLLHPLKDAILYRCGIELLNEWIATDRVNFLAVNGQDWAAAKIQEWRQIYAEKVDYALTSRALKNLQAIDDICFECGANKFGYGI